MCPTWLKRHTCTYGNCAQSKNNLTKDTLETLVQSYIISRLDYRYSLFYGIAEDSLDRLQNVQNAAARLTFGLRKYDHVTEALMELHGIPIRSHIDYKIALITYETLHGDGPEYLKKKILPHKSGKMLPKT